MKFLTFLFFIVCFSSSMCLGDRLVANLPKRTTHYIFNFVDENNFLVSYPEMPDLPEAGKEKGKGPFSCEAFSANYY